NLLEYQVGAAGWHGYRGAQPTNYDIDILSWSERPGGRCRARKDRGDRHRGRVGGIADQAGGRSRRYGGVRAHGARRFNRHGADDYAVALMVLNEKGGTKNDTRPPRLDRRHGAARCVDIVGKR